MGQRPWLLHLFWGRNMARYDRMSALFWIALAIAICTESIRLDPGSLSVPGPGLVPLGCGLALGILGIVGFLRNLKEKESRGEVLWKKGTLWTKLILTLLSIVCYAFLLQRVGFLLMTLLWLMFVCKVGKMGWRRTVIVAVVTTFLCYVLFNYFLGVRFPRGILG